MKANYSCLEYSYNPDAHSKAEIEHKLHQLHFTQRTISQDGSYSVWLHGLSILLLRESIEVNTPGISGIGIFTDRIAYQNLLPDATFDEAAGIYMLTDPNGLRLLILGDEDGQTQGQQNFHVVEKPLLLDAEIDSVCGLVYEGADDATIAYYADFGFKNSQHSKYNILTSDNNRFTMLVDKKKTHAKIPTIIMDSRDIFSTIAKMTLVDVDMVKYDIDPTALNFDDLNHKIYGYNCLAFGNANSYSIEKFLPEALPGLNVIVRERKQYLGIKEESLIAHEVSNV